MPWTQAQNRLFRAAAHNPAIAQSSGIPQDKARQMASEGVKRGAMLAAKLSATPKGK